MKMNKKEVFDIGDAAKIAQSLKDFQSTAQLLSARTPRMIDLYPKQWVALYHGEVQASASSLQSLLQEMDRKSLPRGEAVIRFIDRDRRTMIL